MIPEQAIPENFELVFKLNPLTFIIDQAREVALWGTCQILLAWGFTCASR